MISVGSEVQIFPGPPFSKQSLDRQPDHKKISPRKGREKSLSRLTISGLGGARSDERGLSGFFDNGIVHQSFMRMFFVRISERKLGGSEEGKE